MRLLILFESLVVLALAAGILFMKPASPATPSGDLFPVGNFLLDALPGESVRYRVDEGRSTLSYTVGTVDPGGPKGPPHMQITRAMTDTAGRVVPDPDPSYTHLPHRHGFFPLIAQGFPGAFDRVWVVQHVRRVTVPWQGRPLRCWRVDAIDPALTKDREAVVLFLHENCPVFGIFRWERDGHVYEAEWRPAK